MFPERLSWNLTSLNANEDRIAFVFEFAVGPDGRIGEARVYQAWLRNKAKLTYNAVTAWLEGNAPIPPGSRKGDRVRGSNSSAGCCCPTSPKGKV